MPGGDGSSGKTSTTSDKVKAGADTLVGQNSVGDGECFALADKVLTDSGAKSAKDFGTTAPGKDYVWGAEVTDLKLVQSGDVLQFRDHEFTVKTTTHTVKTHSDGSVDTQDSEDVQTRKRPHHTAIVSGTTSNGQMTIVEQNVADPATGVVSKVVRKNQLMTSGGTTTSTAVTTEKDPDGKPVKVEVETTVTITVKGTIKAYRPVTK